MGQGTATFMNDAALHERTLRELLDCLRAALPGLPRPMETTPLREWLSDPTSLSLDEQEAMAANRIAIAELRLFLLAMAIEDRLGVDLTEHPAFDRLLGGAVQNLVQAVIDQRGGTA